MAGRSSWRELALAGFSRACRREITDTRNRHQLRYSQTGAERSQRPSAARRAEGPVRVQYGALPFRFNAGGNLELLIVTSRGRGRWIIPKGWPIKGFKPHETAAREAFEEAGIRGEVGTKTIGSFPYEKIVDDESGVIDCEIVVFPLRVKRQLKSWPEAGERELLWINPKDIAAIFKRMACAASWRISPTECVAKERRRDLQARA